MLNLAWSFILDFENSANPDENIRNNIFSWKNISSTMIYHKNDIFIYAEKLSSQGFGKKDALHIASACYANVAFFITVDKKILNKAILIKGCKVINPIEFISYLEGKNEN